MARVIVLVEGDRPFRPFEVDEDKRRHDVDFTHCELQRPLVPVRFWADEVEHHVMDLRVLFVVIVAFIICECILLLALLCVLVIELPCE